MALGRYNSFMGTSGVGTTGGSGGHGAYGTVPGPIQVPQNLYQQLLGQYPNLSNRIGGALSNIEAEQGGGVDRQFLQDYAATRGFDRGMPGAGFNNVAELNMAQDQSYNRRRQGDADLLALITGLAPTQTDPGLAAGIADRNATLASAPDPRLAAEEQFRLWEKQFNKLQGAANPAGGTGRPWWQTGTNSGGIPGASYGGGGVTHSFNGLPGPNIAVGGGEAGMFAGGATGPTGTAPKSNFDWSAWIRSLTNPTGGSGANILPQDDELTSFMDTLNFG